MLRAKVILVTFISLNYSSVCKALSFKEAARLALKNDLKQRDSDFELKKIDAQIGQLSTAYASRFQGGFSVTSDKNKSLQASADESLFISPHFSFTKVLSSGTHLNIGIADQYSDLTFPKAAAQMGSAPATNPAHDLSFSLEISQPLLKNWLMRELEIQKELLTSQKGLPKIQQKLQGLGLITKIDHLFCQFGYASDQLKYTKKLIQINQAFLSLTKKRVKIGRSEELDVAKANASLVSAEGRQLELEINLQKITQTVRYLIDPKGNAPMPEIEQHDVSTIEQETKLAELETLYEQAKTHRLDLKLNRQQLEPLKHSLALISEKDKASLDLFAAMKSNGIEEDIFDAAKDTMSFTNPRFSIGLKFTYNLDDDSITAKKMEIKTKRDLINNQYEYLSLQIRKDLHLLIDEYDAAIKQITQAQTHSYYLDKQLRLEKARIRQARSDKLAALRYEMQIIEAQSKLSRARYQAKDAKIKVTFLTHNYPFREYYEDS